MKRVYKLTPVSQYDIAGMESWLQDMAARGLHLKKFRPLFCTFEKGPAAPCATGWSPTGGHRMTTCPGRCWSCTRTSAGTMRTR